MLRIRRLLIPALSATLCLALFPPIASADPALKSPEPGVLCDKYSCADSNGLSKPLTLKYVGKAAVKKVFKYSDGFVDYSQFTFANGVFCDTKEKLCRNDRYFDDKGNRSPVNKKFTKLLFGN